MSMFKAFFPVEAARLALLERRVQALLAAADLQDATDPALDDVVAALRAGQDIRAVQRYSEITGAGIGESRIAVQELKLTLA